MHISPLTARFKIRIKFKSTIKTRNAHRSPLSLILVNLETCLIKVIQRAEPVLASFHIRHKLKVCAYFCVSFTKSLNYIRRFIQQRVRNEWFGICRVGLFNVESSRKWNEKDGKSSWLWIQQQLEGPCTFSEDLFKGKASWRAPRRCRKNCRFISCNNRKHFLKRIISREGSIVIINN